MVFSGCMRILLLSSLLGGTDALTTQRMQESCEDNVNFLLAINSDGRYEPCSWIDSNPNDVDYRRREQCRLTVKEDVKMACPRACGECCGDNPDFQYLYQHDTQGPILIDCNYVGIEDDSRREVLCPLVQVSCPNACGLCPDSTPTETSSPTKAPTASPTKSPTQKPSPEVNSEEKKKIEEDVEVEEKEMTLYFAAELYTKDDTIESGSSVNILKGVNTFLRREMKGFENHEIFTSLDNAGIGGVFFTFLALNAPFEEHQMTCGYTPKTFSNSVCNTAVASAKITYKESPSKRRRRLNEDVSSSIESNIEDIIDEHSESLSTIVDNLVGLSLVNIASNMEALIQETPTISSVNAKEEDGGGGNAAKIAVPIVVVLLLVGLLVGAYIVHQRRRNAIVVELEEGDVNDVEDDYLLSRKARRNDSDSEDMKFPIESNDDTDITFLPDMDHICGSGEKSSA